MRSHYDFAKGVRGKHAEAYRQGTNRITLDADVAAVFPDSESVNKALRDLAEVAARQIIPKRRRKAG